MSRGFLEIDRARRPPTPGRGAARATGTLVQQDFDAGEDRRPGARAAWTAASRSATRAARSGTSSPTGTTSCSATSGGRRSTACTRPTTSRSSPGCVCPAPCEQACVLGINDDPVTIKQIEWEIVRPRLRRGLGPRRCCPSARTGQLGGGGRLGPGGARGGAAADPRRPHRDALREERPDRRPAPLRHSRLQAREVGHRPPARADARGGRRVPDAACTSGVDLSATELRKGFDAIVLCTGAEQPRDLAVPGRELEGVHFAMDFLPQQNRRVAGDAVPAERRSSPTGKHVVILGGGDTGSDCIGTSHRQGARSVTSIELLPQPPEGRHRSEPWPIWPCSTTSTLELARGGRRARVRDRRRSGSPARTGSVAELHGVRVEFDRDRARAAADEHDARGPGQRVRDSRPSSCCSRWASSTRCTRASSRSSASSSIRAATCARTRKNFATSEPGVFAAGDCRRGQSLVVWAQWEGREAARAVDAYLQGRVAPPVAQRATSRRRMQIRARSLDEFRRDSVRSRWRSGGVHSARRRCDERARAGRAASTRRVELRSDRTVRTTGIDSSAPSGARRAASTRFAENCARCARELGERDERIRALEAQLLEANQRRQDTAKRIDELIAQLDRARRAARRSAEPN